MEADFEALFKSHFKALYAYAYTFVRDEIAAEELVQNVFMKIWEKKTDLLIHTSVKSFLYRSVYHESLNYLKHQKVKRKYQQYREHLARHETGEVASNRLQLKELEERLHAALSRLPEGCRTVFQMSRFEELKYREIADRLHISIKTVENQMGKALRFLRLELADFLILIIFILINLYRP